MHRFTLGSSLLEAFEKINLRPNARSNSNHERNRNPTTKTSKPPHNTSRISPRRVMRCYNCNEMGHISSECGRLKQGRDVNLQRGQSARRFQDHQARDFRTTTTTNVVHPPSLKAPYMVPVGYSVSDDEGYACEYSVMAIVDSGSPISLIQSKYVPVPLNLLENTNNHTFRGINGSRLQILGNFETNVNVSGISISINFFVVPDDTMAYAALL